MWYINFLVQVAKTKYQSPSTKKVHITFNCKMKGLKFQYQNMTTVSTRLPNFYYFGFNNTSLYPVQFTNLLSYNNYCILIF